MTTANLLPRERATLVTSDGVRISAAHDPMADGSSDTVALLGHGFTGSWKRPSVRAIAVALADQLGVVSFDFRGHGSSEGESSLGDTEIHDVEAAVDWARSLGYRRVVSVGFSMGASVVLRHAALLGGVSAVAAVSGPAFWYYRGTPSMRFLHTVVESRIGRRAAALTRNTRISSRAWNPGELPLSPVGAVAELTAIDLLIVHGDADHYFPLEHAHALFEASRQSPASQTKDVGDVVPVRRDLWVESGFGHAETAVDRDLVDRIGLWLSKSSQPINASRAK